MDLKTGLDLPYCHSISGTPECSKYLKLNQISCILLAIASYTLALPTVVCLPNGLILEIGWSAVSWQAHVLTWVNQGVGREGTICTG